MAHHCASSLGTGRILQVRAGSGSESRMLITLERFAVQPGSDIGPKLNVQRTSPQYFILFFIVCM